MPLTLRPITRNEASEGFLIRFALAQVGVNESLRGVYVTVNSRALAINSLVHYVGNLWLPNLSGMMISNLVCRCGGAFIRAVCVWLLISS